MTDEDELKPCPFCAGEATFLDGRVVCTKCHASAKLVHYNNLRGVYRVMCTKGTKASRDVVTIDGVAGNAIDAVIEAWNRRADYGEICPSVLGD